MSPDSPTLAAPTLPALLSQPVPCFDTLPAQPVMGEPAATLEKGVVSVYELLKDQRLQIPTYQRPYKWTVGHVEQLFTDIERHRDKSAYRLGTVVFHKENGKRNIVDGQQRSITLVLAAHALIETRLKATEESLRITRSALRGQLQTLSQGMMDPNFKNHAAIRNARNNYLAISRHVAQSEFTEDHIDFLLNQCELVWFELTDISEAFQFFDSQNARGKDLAPHDLLKAFHLREFGPHDQHLKAQAVSHWENADPNHLARVFSQYLFRIRNWSRGASAREFGKQHVSLFKGVNLDHAQRYPYLEEMLLAHQFIDSYNQLHERRIVDSQPMAYPFQLDQTIINGRRFFEMIGHYEGKVGRIQADDLPELSANAADIFQVLGSYEGRQRRGDRYARLLFDCLLIYYLDKFGKVKVSQAVEKAFIWAYSLRLKMINLQLSAMDNHARHHNLFLKIREATQAEEFLSIPLPTLTAGEVRASKAAAITELFRKLRYLDGGA